MSSEINQPVDRPMRPAWMEVDLGRLAANFRLIREDAPAGLEIGSVVKDNGYGFGAVAVANVALGRGQGGCLSAISTRRRSCVTPGLVRRSC